MKYDIFFVRFNRANFEGNMPMDYFFNSSINMYFCFLLLIATLPCTLSVSHLQIKHRLSFEGNKPILPHQPISPDQFLFNILLMGRPFKAR